MKIDLSIFKDGQYLGINGDLHILAMNPSRPRDDCVNVWTCECAGLVQ